MKYEVYRRELRVSSETLGERREREFWSPSLPLFFVSVASKGVSDPVSGLESTLVGILQVLILKKLGCARNVPLFGKENSYIQKVL